MSTDLLESPIHGDVITETDNALAILNSSQLNTQIDIAKRYPRSIKEFKREATELACIDEETAGLCFYSLPRGGKPIEGPSVRLAEICASCWGNIHVATRIIEIGEKTVTSQGIAFDMQRNYASAIEVQRRITTKEGKRYSDDMCVVTANAAASIALRNAVFRVIPSAYVKPIYDAARLASLGKAETIQKRREKALAWFQQAGVSNEQVFEFLGRRGVDDVTTDDLITLTGTRTAIKEGESTIDELFGSKPKKGSRAKKSKLSAKEESASEPAKYKGKGVDWDSARADFHMAETIDDIEAAWNGYIEDCKDASEHKKLKELNEIATQKIKKGKK